MIRTIRSLALGLGVVGASTLLAGCSHDENTAEGRLATEAAGIDSTEGSKQVTETSRDLEVIRTEKVVDPKTGEVLSDKESVTPVTVSKEVKVTKDVDVQVGDTLITDPAHPKP